MAVRPSIKSTNVSHLDWTPKSSPLSRHLDAQPYTHKDRRARPRSRRAQGMVRYFWTLCMEASMISLTFYFRMFFLSPTMSCLLPIHHDTNHLGNCLAIFGRLIVGPARARRSDDDPHLISIGPRKAMSGVNGRAPRSIPPHRNQSQAPNTFSRIVPSLIDLFFPVEKGDLPPLLRPCDAVIVFRRHRQIISSTTLLPNSTLEPQLGCDAPDVLDGENEVRVDSSSRLFVRLTSFGKVSTTSRNWVSYKAYPTFLLPSSSPTPPSLYTHTSTLPWILMISLR